MPICFGKKCKIYIALLSFIFPNTLLSNQPLIDVKIGVMESLSPSAPTSSERYRKLYEAAIYYALGENQNKLKNCGYRVSTSFYYFDVHSAEDLITFTKELEDSDSWAIIGPRRSSQFIATSRFLHGTPLISTMANAEEVYNLNRTTFSMYPRTEILVELISKEVNSRKYGTTFGSIIDARCPSCVDFSKLYRKHNPQHELAFSLSVSSNTPDMTKIAEYLNIHSIDYLLTPNYSELTGYLISEIHKLKPNIKFVGSDGWGEDSFSLLQGYGVQRDAEGISIRAGANRNEINDYYQVYSLNRIISGSRVTPPNSIYSLVPLIRKLSDDLCTARPKNKTEFKQFLKAQDRTHFQLEAKYSIYHLQDGKLEFLHYINDES